MRLFFDQNLSFKLCSSLSDLFPDSVQARILGLDQADDRQIWAYARAEGLIIVTNDADFAELAAFHGPPPTVIWLRSGNLPTEKVAAMLRRYAPEIAIFDQDDQTACLELHA